MEFSVNPADPIRIDSPCLILGAFKDAPLAGSAEAADRASGGALSRLIESGSISVRPGQCSLWPAGDGLACEQILVVGLGKQAEHNATNLNKAAVAAVRYLRDRGIKQAVNALIEIELGEQETAWRARQVAMASDWGNYRYTATRSGDPDNGGNVDKMTFSGDPADLEHPLSEASAIAAGVRRARELGNLPPNICNPAYLADQAREIATLDERAECEVLRRDQMEELGMGALLGVGRGSANEPKLIVLQWKGGEDPDEAPFAFVGKGITFDTGGISLKPGKGMDEMKYDMCGAAGVLGAFEACVRMGLPLNLVTVVPAVENMPDGDAYRPGDVVTSLSGQTIEVLNTDAEGRLILCDALTYVQQRFEPRTLIDAATLTGACVIALGKVASGLMSHDDALAGQLLAAGDATHDRAWRLPIWNDYQPLLDTPYADMQNIGGPTAGAITAGCFLARFAKDVSWAHLDVAGTAWDGGTKNGATGRPVGLLAQYLIDRSQDD